MLGSGTKRSTACYRHVYPGRGWVSSDDLLPVVVSVKKYINIMGHKLQTDSLPDFRSGVFYAVYEDGHVISFGWAEVKSTLIIEPCSK